MKKNIIIKGILIFSFLFTASLLEANCSDLAAGGNFNHCPYWFIIKRDGNWALVELSNPADPTKEGPNISPGRFTVKGSTLVCPNCSHDAWAHDVDESGFTLGPLYEKSEE